MRREGKNKSGIFSQISRHWIANSTNLHIACSHVFELGGRDSIVMLFDVEQRINFYGLWSLPVVGIGKWLAPLIISKHFPSNCLCFVYYFFYFYFYFCYSANRNRSPSYQNFLFIVIGNSWWHCGIVRWLQRLVTRFGLLFFCHCHKRTV